MAMILTRSGMVASSQLAAGIKFSVHIQDELKIAEQDVPVIAVVNRGFYNESGGGIEPGSKLYGVAQFQNGNDRANIQFNAISNSSGVIRDIKGAAVESDGQLGILGDVHSNSLKNTAGQFVSRFVGGYAAGSIERGPLGMTQGGSKNGLMNAISETAQDRADKYAEDLKKNTNGSNCQPIRKSPLFSHHHLHFAIRESLNE